MTQMLLFPDPRPLVDRLGPQFFRGAPQCPGVYLMRDATDSVLYVGKAKNLRRRLGSYRVANPDRMPRRHLRLLRAVARIELRPCPDEPSALTRESELLRTLKPKFNRAGTWPPAPRFLVWRRLRERLELAISEKPRIGWEAFGPVGSVAAVCLRAVLARLLWCAIHPELGASRMPPGWVHGRFESIIVIHTAIMGAELAATLQKLFSDQPGAVNDWLRAKMPSDMHPFDKAAIEADLQLLSDQFRLRRSRQTNWSLLRA
jgi:predicted GIY-YIG superfamily endonuclease